MSLRILVTGAGGLIGGEVAGLLAERGHSVIALVHREPLVRRYDGRAVVGVTVVRGDVRTPGLGLGAGPAFDRVVHCAALTGFDLTPEHYRSVNVEGAANALALATRAGAAMIHVGTAYVCGERDGPIAEDASPAAPDFSNGYEASKAVAECLLRAADPRVVIARPSIVVGASGDGAIRVFDNVYLLLRMFAQGRLKTMPARRDASLDFVPVDLVACGIAELAERADWAAGRAFHLSSGAPVTLDDLQSIAREHAFPTPRFVAPESFDVAALPPAERRLHRLAAPYAAYLRRDPRFARDNARALRGFATPCGGRALLRRVVDYAIAAGFLPGPGTAEPVSERRGNGVRAVA